MLTNKLRSEQQVMKRKIVHINLRQQIRHKEYTGVRKRKSGPVYVYRNENESSNCDNHDKSIRRRKEPPVKEERVGPTCAHRRCK